MANGAVGGEGVGGGEAVGHASLSSHKPQQGQLVPKPGLTYMILRPTPVSSKPLSAELETSTHRPGKQLDLKVSSKPGDSWRATGTAVQSDENQVNAGWLLATTKQAEASPSSDEPLQSSASSMSAQTDKRQQLQPQQVFGESKVTAGRSSVGSNGLEEPQASSSVQHVSRTQNQSSGVKGAARRPSESLTDYGIVDSNYSQGGKHSSLETPGELVSGSTSGGQSEQQQQQVITALGGLREIAATASTSASSSATAQILPTGVTSDDSKTNLIQLSDGENDANSNGNNVKLIESANTNNAEPSQHDNQAGQVVMLPASEERASNNDHNDHLHHHHHQQQRQHPSNHQQSHNGNNNNQEEEAQTA